MAPVLEPDQAASGSLGPSDDRLEGAYVDFFTLRLDAASDVVIDLSSADFSPLLHLFDAEGRVIAQAFDPWGGGEGETAILTTTLQAACYTVAPSSWSPDETGTYTLVLTEGPGVTTAPIPGR